MSYLIGNFDRIPLAFAKGEGSYLTATDGKIYLDFLSGVAVNSLGHTHPAIVRAFAEAMEKPIHVSNYYEIPEQENAAELISLLATNAVKNEREYKAVFANSGAEANEAALKLARKKTGRSKFVSFYGAFHGRTFGTMSVTPKPAIQNGFAPLLPDCEYAEYNSIDSLATIDEKTAAVIVELIQAEGGVIVANQEWISALFNRAKKVGALVILDEVQTGCGRTGSFFTFEQFNLEPDILSLAKGIGGGVPVGVMLAKAEIAEALTPGSHGSTFAGSPFISSVVKAVLGVISGEGFLENVKTNSDYFFAKLREISAAYSDQIKEVRGLGYLIGVDFVEAGAAKKIWIKLREKKVLCGLAGENVLRILPPLIAGKAEIDLFLKELILVLAGIHENHNK